MTRAKKQPLPPEPRYLENLSITKPGTGMVDTTITYKMNQEEWEKTLGNPLPDPEANWLSHFNLTSNGNFCRSLYMSDTTESLPCRLTVYRRQGTTSTPWGWAICVNPPPWNGGRGARAPQDYAADFYENPYLAALAAYHELTEGGFRISDEQPIISLVRASFRRAVRKEADQEST